MASFDSLELGALRIYTFHDLGTRCRGGGMAPGYGDTLVQVPLLPPEGATEVATVMWLGKTKSSISPASQGDRAKSPVLLRSGYVAVLGRKLDIPVEIPFTEDSQRLERALQEEGHGDRRAFLRAMYTAAVPARIASQLAGLEPGISIQDASHLCERKQGDAVMDFLGSPSANQRSSGGHAQTEDLRRLGLNLVDQVLFGGELPGLLLRPGDVERLPRTLPYRSDKATRISPLNQRNAEVLVGQFGVDAMAESVVILFNVADRVRLAVRDADDVLDKPLKPSWYEGNEPWRLLVENDGVPDVRPRDVEIVAAGNGHALL